MKDSPREGSFVGFVRWPASPELRVAPAKVPPSPDPQKEKCPQSIDDGLRSRGLSAKHFV